MGGELDTQALLWLPSLRSRSPAASVRATMKLPYTYAARYAAAPAAVRGRLQTSSAGRPGLRAKTQSVPGILGIAILACGLLVSTHPIVPATAAAVPSFDHVFLIVMENHAYSQIIGSSSAPYINSLAKGYDVATNY